MTKMLAISTLLSFSLCALVGCATPESDDGASSGVEELRSADCPAKVEISLAKPKIMSDAKLLETWTKSFEDEGSEQTAKKDAEEQLTTLASHLEAARGQDAVTLQGTVAQACFYKTVDAKTGKPNGYTVWFAKTGGTQGQLQLRISRDLGDPNTLFFKAPVKTLSPTALELEPGKDATAFAQHNIPEFHGEPGGPNAFIGFADVSAKSSH
jgi:hypothetical protein